MPISCRIILRSASLIACIAISGLLQAQSISGIINSYYKVTGITNASATLTLTNTSGLTSGMRVLLIQMKGAALNSSNSASFGSITAISTAGNFEFNVICSVAGNTVLLKHQLVNTYDATGQLQLVTVPQYTSVTVTDTLTAAAWDPVAGTGGVLAFNATDTVYLNAPISVSGKGFNGGAIQNYTTPTYDCTWGVTVSNYGMALVPGPNQYYSGAPKGEGIADPLLNNEYGKGRWANGGGGGNNHNTGGGGGANFGAGGNGGNRSNEGTFNCHGTNPGIGGLSLSGSGYSLAAKKIFLGGGGGSGHMNNTRGLPGGKGGGICIIKAKVITSAGEKILSNGDRPYNALCSTDPYQAEGDGGGGGGAGGTVILNVDQVNGTCTVEVNGAAGSNSSYHAISPINDCTGPGGGGGGGVLWTKTATLPVGLNLSANGGANGVVSMNSLIAACRGSANGATAGTAGAAVFNYTQPEGTLIICAPLADTGRVVPRNRYRSGSNTLLLQLNPNPVMDFARLQVGMISAGSVSIQLRDQQGRTLRSWQPFLKPGVQQVPLSFSGLASGTYFITVNRGGEQCTLKLVHL